jgi:uncharacterized LabA/DUF88 family protein
MMDRCVILVDVGYLLAEGGKAYCGANRRSQVRCDYGDVALALEDIADKRSKMPLLRSYWYDGAPDYVPTQDHLAIAGLPRVKLRLGRLVTQRKGVQQKGVDSLIVHDLITLGHERAVATVFLLAGDEDLREGVAAAQRLGVQVILLGIPTAKPNQSHPLIREADEHVLIEDKLLKQFFQKAGFQPGAPAPLAPAAEKDPKAAVAKAAQEFAASWVDGADISQVGDLLAHEPQIPRELDVQLLTNAEEAVGLSLRGQEELRHVLRAAFWAEVNRRAKASLAGVHEEGSSESDKPQS